MVFSSWFISDGQRTAEMGQQELSTKRSLVQCSCSVSTGLSRTVLLFCHNLGSFVYPVSPSCAPSQLRNTNGKVLQWAARCSSTLCKGLQWCLRALLNLALVICIQVLLKEDFFERFMERMFSFHMLWATLLVIKEVYWKKSQNPHLSAYVYYWTKLLFGLAAHKRHCFNKCLVFSSRTQWQPIRELIL